MRLSAILWLHQLRVEQGYLADAQARVERAEGNLRVSTVRLHQEYLRQYGEGQAERVMQELGRDGLDTLAQELGVGDEAISVEDHDGLGPIEESSAQAAARAEVTAPVTEALLERLSGELAKKLAEEIERLEEVEREQELEEQRRLAAERFEAERRADLARIEREQNEAARLNEDWFEAERLEMEAKRRAEAEAEEEREADKGDGERVEEDDGDENWEGASLGPSSAGPSPTKGSSKKPRRPWNRKKKKRAEGEGGNKSGPSAL